MPGHGKECLDNFSTSLGSITDDFDTPFRPGSGDLFLHHQGMTDDDGQRIVQFMSDTRQKFTQCRHFFTLEQDFPLPRQFFLQRQFFRQVAGIGDDDLFSPEINEAAGYSSPEGLSLCVVKFDPIVVYKFFLL